jgi:hypothetical protein
MMLAEIIVLLYREQSASSLFKCVAESQEQDREAREVRLRRLRKQEDEERAALLRTRRSRHPRFGGTFRVTMLKGSSKDTVPNQQVEETYALRSDAFLHTPTNLATNEAGKVHRTRRRINDTEAGGEGHRSPLEIRVALYEHACAFINTAFNAILPSIERELERYASLAGASDEVLHYDRMNYLRLVRLFLEFHRLQLEAARQTATDAQVGLRCKGGWGEGEARERDKNDSAGHLPN